MAAVVRLRRRQAVDRLDELRAVRVLAKTMKQTELAKVLAISQPSINKALKAAAKVPEVREGFSGGSPYEIVQRFAAGQIDRDQLVDELGRWEYARTPATDGVDWLADEPVGTFEEVGRALDEGLIDEDTYTAILEARR
ncbi:hypothetical protein [Isoptericola rhizosphaerae]|uniref:hypothetical protein n=1 Tax=Isoptericola rhizosphaerae TaxID=3377837 RepID=UPI00383A8B03